MKTIHVPVWHVMCKMYRFVFLLNRGNLDENNGEIGQYILPSFKYGLKWLISAARHSLSFGSFRIHCFIYGAAKIKTFYYYEFINLSL